jgi:hypothetical protein
VSRAYIHHRVGRTARKADERARGRANAARRGGYGSAMAPARRNSSTRAGV